MAIYTRVCVILSQQGNKKNQKSGLNTSRADKVGSLYYAKCRFFSAWCEGGGVVTIVHFLFFTLAQRPLRPDDLKASFPVDLPCSYWCRHFEVERAVYLGTHCCRMVPGVRTEHGSLSSLFERHCMGNICTGMVSPLFWGICGGGVNFSTSESIRLKYHCVGSHMSS